MYPVCLKIVVFAGVAAALLAASAGDPAGAGDLPAAGRDLTRAEAGRVLELIYQGKTQAASVFLDTIPGVDRDQPFYLLVKSRLAREYLPVDDDRKDRLEKASEPVHRDLDRVIRLCTERLETPPDSAKSPYLLYRGVAWMSKAHLQSFARHFWSAGRDAKKGKSDLQDYLAEQPDDPLALGTLGVFLYFADTIPTLVKYISKLLLMPGGDREKGLEYLHRAARMESIFRTDYQVVEASIDLLFEGRFEDGLEATNRLLEEHPDYARLAVPLALMMPFDPYRLPAAVQTVEGAMLRSRHHPDGAATGGAEPYPLALLEFLAAHARRFVAPADSCEASLTRLAEPVDNRPDWINGYATFELGRLMASNGRMADAGRTFAFVRQHPDAAFLREEADEMERALDRYPPGAPQRFPVDAIYFGTREERELLLERPQFQSPETPAGLFYLGETLLLNGHLDEALAVYTQLADLEAAPWDEEFQLLGACRAAEIHGAGGDYAGAAGWLERAQRYYHKEYLVDWLLEARRGYYKRLEKGKETVTPRLLAGGR